MTARKYLTMDRSYAKITLSNEFVPSSRTEMGGVMLAPAARLRIGQFLFPLRRDDNKWLTKKQNP